MHIITSHTYITNMLECRLMPATVLHYLTTEFKVLEISLHHDTEQSFSLDNHGYHMIVLEAGDRDYCIFIGSNCLSLLDTQPEYVELIQLSDGVCMYRACLMPDNECFVLVYALVGALDAAIKRWFVQQIVGITGEEFQ